jgi:predicted ATP-dependent serine protease
MCGLACSVGDVVYIAAEEALSEIKSRADRLALLKQESIVMVNAIEGGVEISEILEKVRPKFIVLDSIQGLVPSEGGQVEACKRLKAYCVAYEAPAIVISQVNKGHQIAGLMALQHVVDATFSFDVQDDIRCLTTIKNRFGRSNVSVFYEMDETGLIVLDEEMEGQ